MGSCPVLVEDGPFLLDLYAAVLRGILDEADAARVPVTLHVVVTNPARRLYERLGFRALTSGRQGDVVHVPMERPPPVTTGSVPP